VEKRIVLKNCGAIDPGHYSHLKKNGFAALEKAQQMMPDQVIGEVTASGLLGRGGAGFSCGLKWKLARESAEDKKYIICNADEGEVGTFKDRYILETIRSLSLKRSRSPAMPSGHPNHSSISGAEYHFLFDLVLSAIGQAKQKGYLKHLDIELREGAGSYMCGEESALMNSIED